MAIILQFMLGDKITNHPVRYNSNMKIKTLKEMIGNQPDDTEVEFIKSLYSLNKIIFKVGHNGTMIDLVYP